MAVNGEVTINWADGEHKFNIAKIKCVLELEEKCGVGVAEIFKRLREDRWHVNDVRETLRLGLIGGGMMPDRALRFINRYCDDQPAVASLQLAMVILMAYMVGVPGDEVGKKPEPERAKDDQPSETTADMSAPSSTESVLPSDSLQGTSMK